MKEYLRRIGYEELSEIEKDNNIKKQKFPKSVELWEFWKNISKT